MYFMFLCFYVFLCFMFYFFMYEYIKGMEEEIIYKYYIYAIEFSGEGWLVKWEGVRKTINVCFNAQNIEYNCNDDFSFLKKKNYYKYIKYAMEIFIEYKGKFEENPKAALKSKII